MTGPDVTTPGAVGADTRAHSEYTSSDAIISDCSDILKGVLLHSLITGLVDDGGEGGGGGGSVRQSGGGAGSAGGRELERARFQNLLLANSRSDATTSLTSSSPLPQRPGDRTRSCWAWPAPTRLPLHPLRLLTLQPLPPASLPRALPLAIPSCRPPCSRSSLRA